MRLIDADALEFGNLAEQTPWTMEAVIDAAPTVRCEERDKVVDDMTDWPEAVREWEKYSSLGGYLPPEENIIAKADAAIKALEAEVERLKPHPNHGSHWDGCWRAGGHHSCAIAEVERLTVALEDFHRTQRQDSIVQRLKQAEAEVAAVNEELSEWIRLERKTRAEVERLRDLALKFSAQLIEANVWDAAGWTPEIMADLDPADIAASYEKEHE